MVIKFGIAHVGWSFTAIAQHGAAGITLPQFHTMAVELVVLQLDGLFQRCATLTTHRATGIEFVKARPAFGLALAGLEP
ncbi:hypothetical protein D3C77_279990 [compost metagenome]